MAIGIRPTASLRGLAEVFLALTMLVTFLNCTAELESEEACPNCDEFECLSGVLNQSSCSAGTIYQEKVAVCGCCPACVKFSTLNEDCEIPDDELETNSGNITVENGIFVSKDCAPGLYCQIDELTGSGTCSPNTGKCDSYQYLDETFWNPICDPNGDFSAVQQKGDFLSGRRFCYNSDGKRIFGQSWRNIEMDITCACSREAASIEAEGKRSDSSFHCTQWGNYERLQCDDGICWCSDIETGVPESTAVPTQMLALLPCHLERDDGNHYLRECESAAVAAGRIKDILKKHGTNNTNLEVEFCDPDGSYGSYQIMKDQVRCTWKDSTILSGYACPVDQLVTVNCNCARDSKLFELNGLPLYLTCGGNGNYNPIQVSGEKSFCVDSDGYPTTDLMDKVNCPSFA